MDISWTSWTSWSLGLTWTNVLGGWLGGRFNTWAWKTWVTIGPRMQEECKLSFLLHRTVWAFNLEELIWVMKKEGGGLDIYKRIGPILLKDN